MPTHQRACSGGLTTGEGPRQAAATTENLRGPRAPDRPDFPDPYFCRSRRRVSADGREASLPNQNTNQTDHLPQSTFDGPNRALAFLRHLPFPRLWLRVSNRLICRRIRPDRAVTNVTNAQPETTGLNLVRCLLSRLPLLRRWLGQPPFLVRMLHDDESIARLLLTTLIRRDEHQESLVNLAINHHHPVTTQVSIKQFTVPSPHGEITLFRPSRSPATFQNG
jgi:hypothetical protein